MSRILTVCSPAVYGLYGGSLPTQNCLGHEAKRVHVGSYKRYIASTVSESNPHRYPRTSRQVYEINSDMLDQTRHSLPVSANNALKHAHTSNEGNIPKSVNSTETNTHIHA